jgi:ATP synthase protein I
MSTISPVKSTLPTQAAWEDEVNEPQFKPLTHEEALRWRATQPVFSAWRLVGVQVLVGLASAALAWLLMQSVAIALSVLYGAASIVIPTAVMAWGVTSSALTRRAADHVISAFMSFVLWEGVKILLSVAMLWSAPRIVPELNWLALLAGLVLVLKVYWFGFWIQTSRKNKSVDGSAKT